MASLREIADAMDAKLDELIAAKNMGEGALWLFFKAAGLVAILVGAATWLANHVKLLLPLAVLVSATVATVAVSQTPHAQFHSVYEGWLTVTGGSCCNDQDCRGAEAWRFGTTGYQVMFDGAWHDVPPAAVRPYASPDGNAHVCVWNGNILCFVPGSGA